MEARIGAAPAAPEPRLRDARGVTGLGGGLTAIEAPPEQEQQPGLETGVDEEREHAVASLKRKRKFMQDAGAYVTVNGLLWLIWLISDRTTDGSIPWPAWVSLVWGFFLALDGWRAYSRWPTSMDAPVTDAEIEREIQRNRRP